MEREERYFKQWVALYPYMTKDTFISFEEYKDNLTGANIDKRPTEEILKEIEEVEKSFK